MVGLSKVFVRDFPIGLTLLALALAGGITSLQAAPTCTNTIRLTGNMTIDNSNLGAGVFVQSGDKTFGDFNFGNLPPSGYVTFTTNPAGDRHSDYVR